MVLYSYLCRNMLTFIYGKFREVSQQSEVHQYHWQPNTLYRFPGCQALLVVVCRLKLSFSRRNIINYTVNKTFSFLQLFWSQWKRQDLQLCIHRAFSGVVPEFICYHVSVACPHKSLEQFQPLNNLKLVELPVISLMLWFKILNYLSHTVKIIISIKLDL